MLVRNMSEKPLVTCIIIFFNAEKFFEEAIESILTQTYDNWELLLVDDGSSDSSTSIAKCYAEQYLEKIRYFEHAGHQNLGMSATRNLGIYYATGEYIAFLDADDVWLPHKLEQQIELMKLHPDVGMVYGKSLYWQSWNGKYNDQNADYIPDAYVATNRLYKPATLMTISYPLGSATAPPPSNILLRRNVIKSLGGFEEGFQKIYQMYEDQAFFAKLYLRFPVFVADECWDKYRLHPDSCTSLVSQTGQYHQVRLFFLNWLQDYFKEQNVKDFQLWLALRKALLPYRYPILYRLFSFPKQIFCKMKKSAKVWS